MVAAARIIKRWEQALLIGKPATLLRWPRDMYCRWWTRKSKAARKASTTLAVDTIALIREMVKENPLWGAERIRGELLKLGG
jgi:hypothetical protein